MAAAAGSRLVHRGGQGPGCSREVSGSGVTGRGSAESGHRVQPGFLRLPRSGQCTAGCSVTFGAQVEAKIPQANLVGVLQGSIPVCSLVSCTLLCVKRIKSRRNVRTQNLNTQLELRGLFTRIHFSHFVCLFHCSCVNPNSVVFSGSVQCCACWVCSGNKVRNFYPLRLGSKLPDSARFRAKGFSLTQALPPLPLHPILGPARTVPATCCTAIHNWFLLTTANCTVFPQQRVPSLSFTVLAATILSLSISGISARTALCIGQFLLVAVHCCCRMIFCRAV